MEGQLSKSPSFWTRRVQIVAGISASLVSACPRRSKRSPIFASPGLDVSDDLRIRKRQRPAGRKSAAGTIARARPAARLNIRCMSPATLSGHCRIVVACAVATSRFTGDPTTLVQRFLVSRAEAPPVEYRALRRLEAQSDRNSATRVDGRLDRCTTT